MFLFIAVNFDDTVKNELGGIAGKLKAEAASGNFTATDNFHLTLVFIGETDERGLPLITGVIDSVAQKPFGLTLGGLGKFDRPGGDIYWFGVTPNPALSGLNSFLSEGLRERGFDIERRRFRPHITLGRQVILRSGFDRAAFEAALPQITFEVNRISLMKSERIRGQIKYFEVYGKDL
jgi:2'-5' RNA ligase